MKTCNFFLTAALVVLGTAARAQGVGTTFPDVTLERFAQTSATSLDDYWGRALLIEFFAHWCGPCAKQVPHLNALQAKYGKQGLSIVGVTGEDEAKTRAWMAQNRAAYAYAFDPSGRLGKHFDVQSIPHAVLVDPFGTVVWTGHPALLPEDLLRETLKDALGEPIAGWPPSTLELQRLLKQRKYARALSAAVTLGEPYESLVRERIATLVAAVKRQQETGDYLGATRLGERTVADLSGLREAVEVKGVLDRMRRDVEVQRVVEAQREILACAEALRVRRDTVPNVVKRLTRVRDEHPGTIAAVQAQRALDALAEQASG